jgi:uncharacterized membrane protein
MWFDETYTLLIANMGISDSIRALVADGVHPPFYYLLQRIFLLFGESETTLRLLSVLMGTLAVPLLFYVGKRWVGQWTGIVASSFLALSPLHIWYAQEARMYALLVTMAIAIMFFYHQVISGRNLANKLSYILLSALAYLTHYFALMFPVIQLLHISRHLKRYWRSLRLWMLLNALAVIPLLVWVIALARREGQYFGIAWIPEPAWADPILTLVNFTVGITTPIGLFHGFGLVAMLILFYLGLRATWSIPDTKTLALGWGFAPLLLTFAISFQRPVYIDRFLLFSLPAILLIAARGVTSLPQTKALVMLSIVLGLFSFGAFRLNWHPLQQKEAWREAAQILLEAEEGEVIVPRILQSAVPLYAYYTGDTPIQAMEVNREVTSLEVLAEGKRGLWLVYWNTMTDAHLVSSDPQFNFSHEMNPIVQKWISGRGPKLVKQIDLRGVTIFHFRLDESDD